jgi:hypothetical protein
MTQFRKVELILTEAEAEMLETEYQKALERDPDHCVSLDAIVSTMVSMALSERRERRERLATITQ